MKYFISALMLLSLASAEDLMAVCFSNTKADMCKPDGSSNSRVLLAQQGVRTEEMNRRRRLNTECGQFCANWDTFCAEYMCDGDTLGATCDEIVAEAKQHMQEIATTVGTEACMKQMDPSILECICVDQET